MEIPDKDTISRWLRDKRYNVYAHAISNRGIASFRIDSVRLTNRRIQVRDAYSHLWYYPIEVYRYSNGS
jgi:hypothetical protein